MFRHAAQDGRAWAWWRRMESGEFGTIEDLAQSIGLGERHVSRLLRLAYLSPEVLKRIACGREAAAISLHSLCFLVGQAWDDQAERVFG